MVLDNNYCIDIPLACISLCASFARLSLSIDNSIDNYIINYDTCYKIIMDIIRVHALARYETLNNRYGGSVCFTVLECRTGNQCHSVCKEKSKKIRQAV